MKFFKILKNKLKVKSFKNIEETLKEIFSEITIQKSKKNIIFFSPAGASFDSFKNFEERGCLLYTSDDEYKVLALDIFGRRIIKKK